MTDAALDIQIKGNSTGFGRVAAETTRQINGIKDAVKSIPVNAIQGLGSSLVAFVSVDFIARQAAGIVDYAGKISDLSERVGVTTDFLQAADYAAKQFGANLEDVVTSIRELKRSSANALTNPKGPDAKAFRELGISIEMLRSMSAEELFRAVAKSLENAALSGSRLNDVMAILGRSAASLIPMLRGGFGGIEEEARRLGVIIDKDMVAQLDEAGDKWARIGLQAKVAFAPLVSAALSFVDVLMKVDELVRTVVKSLLDLGNSGKNNDSWFKGILNIAGPVQALIEKWSAESKKAPKPAVLADQPARAKTGKDITVPLGAPNADAMQRLGLFINGPSSMAAIAAKQLTVAERALDANREMVRELKNRL